MEVTITIPAACIAHCKKLGVQEDNIDTLITAYINESLGLYTFYGSTDHFTSGFVAWMDNPNDAAELLNEIASSKEAAQITIPNIDDEDLNLNIDDLMKQYWSDGDIEAQDFDTFGEDKI